MREPGSWRAPEGAREARRARLAGTLASWRLAPDGEPRPAAPFGRGPLAARVLARVIDGAALVGSRVPARVVHPLAAAGGTVEWAVRSRKRRMLSRNLAHALGRKPGDPSVRRAVRREMVNEARRSADLLWALGRRDRFRQTTQIHGLRHITDALRGGRGLILAGIHVGGWELATSLPEIAVPVPTTAIVADDWLAWAIDHLRNAGGLRTLYRSGSALAAARILRRGECLLVLGDDGWGDEPRSYPVDFLDARAELPAGIVSLARLCRTPIVCFYVLPAGPRCWTVELDPPVSPPAREEGEEGERRVLQQLARRWSDVITANPEHWAAVYRVRWLDEVGSAAR